MTGGTKLRTPTPLFKSSSTAVSPPVPPSARSTPTLFLRFKPTLYASVLASPVPAYVEGSSTYGLVDFSILKNAVKIGLYNPYTLFATIAQGLAELQSGNGITIYTMQLDDAPYECSREGSAEPYKNAWETVYAVACGDAVENTVSADGLYWDDIKDTSSFADSLMFQYVGCSYMFSFACVTIN